MTGSGDTKYTPQAVVFDCDGVLFDSKTANLAYYNCIFSHCGVAEVADDDEPLAELCHTAATPEVLRCIVGEKLLPMALDFARQLDYRQFIAQLCPESGLCATLPRLAQRYLLAIATNRGASMVDILEYFGLDKYFTQVITYLDVERPKPQPDMLLLAARRLGLIPEQLVFVGDSDLDRRAAQAAGCRFIAYGWDGGTRIDCHSQLPTLLDEKFHS